jgi:hypothetical protein
MTLQSAARPFEGCLGGYKGALRRRLPAGIQQERRSLESISGGFGERRRELAPFTFELRMSRFYQCEQTPGLAGTLHR